jgi:hypothetical protein
MIEAEILTLGGGLAATWAHANPSWCGDDVFARARSLQPEETFP